MADNTILSTNVGTGNTLRTLDDGSVHWPVGVVAYATTVGTPDVLTIPTAAALADDTANPTTLLGGSCVLWYDGTTWDRARGTSADGLLVNLGSNNDVTITSGTITTVSTVTAVTTVATVTNLAQLGGAAVPIGAGLEATAIRVTLPTDGTGKVSAAQSGVWDITNVSGTVSLPTGAATAANQSTLIGHVDGIEGLLTTIDADTSTLAVVGGGLEATALRVTLASDSTGVLSVDDNGGAITVDNGGTFAVQAAQSGTWSVRTQDGAGNALTSAARGSERALSVQLVDGSGNQITTFGGGTQYAEDAGHGSGDTGTMALAVRNDADTSLCGTTLDYTPLQVDANGFLKVNIKAGAGSGGTASTDDAAFTAAAGSGTPMMGFVTADSVDSGDVGVVGMLANRQLKVTLYDSGGIEAAVGGGTQYTEGAIDATITGNAILWEDAADTLVAVSAAKPLPVSYATTGSGTAAGALRVELPTNGTGVIATVGAVTAITNALPAGTNAIGKLAANSGVDIGDVDITSIAAGDNNIGNVDIVTVPSDPFGANADAGSATGSISAKLRFIASTGIPITGTVTVGSHAVTNAGTFVVQVDGTALTRLTDIETNTDSCAVVGNGAAATAQRVSIANDSTGILAGVTTVTTVTTCSTVTTLTGGGIAHDSADSGNPHKIGAKATASLSGATMVAAADRTDLFAGIDGVQITRPHCNLEDVVSNTASNTDGTSTQVLAAGAAGIKHYLTTVILANTSASNIYVEIKDGTTVKLIIPVPANGGAVCNLPVPIPGTAATAWNFDPSAATTTVYCSVVGFKSKV